MAFLANLFKLRQHPVIQSLGTYTFTNFFGKGVAFLLLPYFTNVLSRSDIGLVNLFSSSVIFLMPFISLGVLQSINADFFKLDKKSFKDAFTSSLILPVIVCLISLLLFFFSRNYLQEQYHFPTDFIWLIPVITLLSFVGEHTINMIRNNNQPKQFMGVVLGRLFIEVALAVVLISIFKMGWAGRVNGILLSYICLTVYAMFFFIRKGYLFGQLKKAVIREELVYSVPIIVMQFSVFCMNSSDSFFLSRFTHDNNAEVGVYAIACVFGSIILTLCSALLQYMVPKIYSLLSEPVVNYTSIRKHFLLYAGIMTGGLLLLILCIPLAYKYVINKDYLPGLRYYYLLCTGYYFWTIAYFFYSFLLYHKKKKKLLLLSLSSVVISLCSNYFFIKNMASAGAAISVCSSYFIVLMITLIFTKEETGFLFKKTTLTT